MNTYEFHDQATRAIPGPPAVSAAELVDMSDLEHAQHLARVTHWVAGTYLTTTATQQLAAAIDIAITYNEATLPGSKTIIGLSGPNAVGKSTLMHQWSRDYYRRATASFPVEGHLPRWSPERDLRADLAPIVWINLQSNAKIAEVDALILAFLRAGSTGTVRDMTLRAVRAMGRHRTRVLVIDDVHLLDTQSRAGRGVLDHIKHLNTEIGEFGGSLILVGADLHTTALVHDPQIANRLRLHTLTRFPAETPTGRRRPAMWLRICMGRSPSWRNSPETAWSAVSASLTPAPPTSTPSGSST